MNWIKSSRLSKPLKRNFYHLDESAHTTYAGEVESEDYADIKILMEYPKR